VHWLRLKLTILTCMLRISNNAREMLFRKSDLMLSLQDSGEKKREERTGSVGFFEGDDLEVHGFYEQADKELYDDSHIKRSL
jgi:hypothetical protein